MLLARNAYNAEFASRVAFIASNVRLLLVHCDRSEFIGRGRRLGKPAALTRTDLGQRVGAGYDPCGAIQMEVVLAPGEQRVVVLMLGEGNDLQEVEAIGAATVRKAPRRALSTRSVGAGTTFASASR